MTKNTKLSGTCRKTPFFEILNSTVPLTLLVTVVFKTKWGISRGNCVTPDFIRIKRMRLGTGREEEFLSLNKKDMKILRKTSRNTNIQVFISFSIYTFIGTRLIRHTLLKKSCDSKELSSQDPIWYKLQIFFLIAIYPVSVLCSLFHGLKF